MPLKSYSELAQSLEDAYIAIMTGKVASYSVGGDNYTRHNLDGLEKAMLRFRALAQRATYGMTTLADQRDREV